MKKQKSNTSRNKFVSPKSYIKRPSFEKNNISDYEIETAKLKQKEKIRKKQIESYSRQQALIESGQMPSQSRAEFESFISRDKFKRVKAPPLKLAPMYSREQNFLQDLFGQGDKVMFNNSESQCRPKINGALMPNRMGDNSDSWENDETAEIGGFGRHRQRSGLF